MKLAVDLEGHPVHVRSETYSHHLTQERAHHGRIWTAAIHKDGLCTHRRKSCCSLRGSSAYQQVIGINCFVISFNLFHLFHKEKVSKALIVPVFLAAIHHSFEAFHLSVPATTFTHIELQRSNTTFTSDTCKALLISIMFSNCKTLTPQPAPRAPVTKLHVTFWVNLQISLAATCSLQAYHVKV